MYRIKTFNKISPVGLNRLDPELYAAELNKRIEAEGKFPTRD